jgi:hypothetical protein
VPATNAGEHLWTRNFLHEAGFDLLVSPLSLVQPQLLNLVGRGLAEAHHHGMGKMYSLARVQAQGFGFKIREVNSSSSLEVYRTSTGARPRRIALF